MQCKVTITLDPMEESEANRHLKEIGEEIMRYDGFIKGHSIRTLENMTSVYIAEFNGYPDGILYMKKPWHKQISVNIIDPDHPIVK